MKFLLSAIICLAAVLCPATADAENYNREARAIGAKTRKLFNSKNWLALEEFVNTALIEKTTITCGEPVLYHIHQNLDPSKYLSKSDPDKKWEAWHGKLDEWEKAAPDSIVVPTVRVLFWASFAWKARGDHGASTVTEDGWEKFDKRLKKAKAVFIKHTAHLDLEPYPSPGIYGAAMLVALGQKWSEEECYDLLLDPMIQVFPEHFLIYNVLGNFLQPKWYGKDGDDYRFYRTITDRIGGRLGEEMYARVLVKMTINAYHSYRPDLVDWELVKKGMVEASRKSPKSTYLVNEFVKFAHRHDDQQGLIDMIAEAAPETVTAFYKSSPYGKALELRKNSPPSCLVPIRYFRPEGLTSDNDVRAISPRPGSDNFLVSYGYGGISEFTLAEGGQIKFERAKDRFINRIAAAPDGKHMAFLSGADKHMGHDTAQLQIRTTDDDWEIIRTATMELGNVDDTTFTADSGAIIFHFYPDKKSRTPATYRWDWKTEGSSPKKLLADQKGLGYCIEVDAKTNSLYFNTGKVMKYELDEPENPLFNVTKNLPKGTKLETFKLVDDGETCIALTSIPKNRCQLFLIRTKDAHIITSRILEELGKGEWYIGYSFSKKLQKPVITTSGTSGCMTTWTVDKKEDTTTISYQSTIPQNGRGTYKLTSLQDQQGNEYIIQGTINGMIGLYRME